MRDKLRTQRLQRGLTLNQVAQRIGLTKSAYSNIESGRRKPSLDVAFSLERFFNVPASELLAVEGEQSPNAESG